MRTSCGWCSRHDRNAAEGGIRSDSIVCRRSRKRPCHAQRRLLGGTGQIDQDRTRRDGRRRCSMKKNQRAQADRSRGARVRTQSGARTVRQFALLPTCRQTWDANTLHWGRMAIQHLLWVTHLILDDKNSSQFWAGGTALWCAAKHKRKEVGSDFSNPYREPSRQASAVSRQGAAL